MIGYKTIVLDTHTERIYTFRTMGDGIRFAKELTESHGYECVLYKLDTLVKLGSVRMNHKLPYRLKSNDYKPKKVTARFVRTD